MSFPGQRCRAVLLGAGGQLGIELGRALAAVGDVEAYDREALDVCDTAAVRRVIRGHRPTVIVNAAAYTKVDRAEVEPELSRRVNAVAPGLLAEESERCGALLVHFSTDYVFDGTQHTPYTEEDEARPLNVYGETKLAGEQAVRRAGGRYLIFRTSWLYAVHGRNFLRTILRLARERDELRVVDDQFGCPTWCGWLAGEVARVVKRHLKGDGARSARGTYHLASGGAASWYDFADAILARSRLTGSSAANCRIVPIPTSEYLSPARRPAYSVLDSGHAAGTFSLSIPSWREQLEEAMRGL